MNTKSFVLLCMAALALAGCAAPAPKAPNDWLAVTAQASTSDWATPIGKGVVMETTHYRVYTTASRPATRNNLAPFMEACYQNYLVVTGLGDRPGMERMDVYMMETREEWAALTQARLGPASEIYLGIQAGGYCHDGVGVFWDIGGLATFSVASHEGLHQFFAHRLRDHLPAWLEEGLCTSAEGFEMQGSLVRFTPLRNLPRFTALRTALVEDRWIPLEKLLAMDAGDVTSVLPEYAVGYYAQLWALAQFLRAHPVYGERVRQLLRDAQAGTMHQKLKLPPGAVTVGRAGNRQISVPVFRTYFTTDLTAFDKEFRQFAMGLGKLK